MKFARKKFFDGFKKHFDSSLDQSQVDGVEFLLTSFEKEPLWKDVRHIAYALATVYHETAASMQPVEEGYYLGSPTRKELPKDLTILSLFWERLRAIDVGTQLRQSGQSIGRRFCKES